MCCVRPITEASIQCWFNVVVELVGVEDDDTDAPSDDDYFVYLAADGDASLYNYSSFCVNGSGGFQSVHYCDTNHDIGVNIPITISVLHYTKTLDQTLC